MACSKSAGLPGVVQADAATVSLPDTPPGIGFDDLRYSPGLHRVLAPSGRSGRINLIDPVNLQIQSISGFSATAEYTGGHDDGPTSVEEALGKLYATDRTTRTLVAMDPKTGHLGLRVKLAAEPDYVRFVPDTRELWVTEPSADQIEIFALSPEGDPSAVATIPVENGPESLVVDSVRGRAYTHRWQRSTLALDLRTRAVVAEWPNGCAASRGIALDERRGWLFSGCNEGPVLVLDVAHDGRILSRVQEGSGFDVIGYNAGLGHLYLAGSVCSCLVMLGVDPKGQLTLLERRSAPPRTHCVTADDAGNAWVCDPDRGRLLRVRDRHPSTLN
ncbi:MAG TPA: hypothetical protein VG937_23695 [Polyangiaceae bacterium]|jgi:DNA-binding beta-propeller fold protein YncE|nr:hypothetical protein [Polyangiaceae bacterium]